MAQSVNNLDKQVGVRFMYPNHLPSCLIFQWPTCIRCIVSLTISHLKIRLKPNQSSQRYPSLHFHVAYVSARPHEDRHHINLSQLIAFVR